MTPLLENKKITKSFHALDSRGADGQQRIEAVPDSIWEPKTKTLKSPPVLEKAGHLLVYERQNASSARLTAVASNKKWVGSGWMPAIGLNATQAKALAVFLNSTSGRLMIMSRISKKTGFPQMNPGPWHTVGIPNINDPHILNTLADCWEETRHIIVPQYRDGYIHPRPLWDEAVAKALNWDIQEWNELGELLAKEPHVRGVAYDQWKE